jgi:hypothetical protein
MADGNVPDEKFAEFDALLQRLLKYTEESWGKATAYDTAITVAGYGAFFALWSGVAIDVTSVARDVTAALMGVSLLCYIGWHIILMLARHWHDSALVEVIATKQSPAEMIQEWTSLEDKQRSTLLGLQGRLWKPVFGTAVLTGAAGALTLIYNCIAIATRLPQLTG